MTIQRGIEVPRRDGTKFIHNVTDLGLTDVRLSEIGGRIVVTASNHPPFFVNEDGTRDPVTA